MITIYELCDPMTGEVRYVGLTRDVKRRRRQYRHQGHTPHLTNWLNSLGQDVVFEVLEVVTAEEADQREQFWIRILRDYGARLLNYTSGGEGNFEWPPERRARLRELALNRNAIAVTQTPEAREKRRRSAQGIHRPWAGPRMIALNKSRTGIPLSPEHRQHVSASLIGRPFSVATREIIRANAVRRWKDPAYRVKQLMHSKKGGANPAGRIASAEKRRGIPLTDEHKRKVSETMKGRRNQGLINYWLARKQASQ